MSAGKHSRLTITPERITVKVAPGHTEMTGAWADAANAIAEHLDFDRSLRGCLRPDRQIIWLATSHRCSSNFKQFLYDFNGELLGEAG